MGSGVALAPGWPSAWPAGTGGIPGAQLEPVPPPTRSPRPLMTHANRSGALRARTWGALSGQGP